MEFLTLDAADFVYGEPQEILPGVRRIVAANPSKFTYHGTGTYVLGSGDGVVVVDPGPDLDTHRDALAAALRGDTVRAILVTHCHSDHSPLSAWLQAETGAPTYAFGPHGDDEWDIGDDPAGTDDPDDASSAAPTASDDASQEPVIEESIDRAFTPDVVVRTGDVVVSGAGRRVTAVHTPGHTSNHTCFAVEHAGTRTLFTGDHVMGWSTTVVAPPDGDMAAYIESLRRVAGRRDDVAVPTHGPPIPDPAAFVEGLVDHRLAREAQVLAVVRDGVAMIPAMVEILYVGVRRELHKPARRSVLAHLVKLVADGLVVVGGAERPRLDATYHPT